jgi:hypothetical protein
MGAGAMRISNRHKFILISNPKCASQSLRALLDPYSTIRGRKTFPYNNHVTARRLKQKFDEAGWDWSNYLTLTTVRNPWDRMVSFWAFGKQEPRSVWAQLAERTGGGFEAFVAGFPDYLAETLMPPPDGREGQFGFDIRQIAFSEAGERLIETIIPVEQLSDQVPAIFQRLGLDAPQLIHKNASPRGDYRSYYTSPVSIDGVAQLFAPDIEMFGYQFDQLDPAP